MSDFKIRPETSTLADRIEALMDCNAKGELTGDQLFRKIATEDGRDVDRMIDDDFYRAGFVAAGHLAGGRKAAKAMTDNKDLGTVSGTFEIGRSVLEMSFERHKRVPNRTLDKESGDFVVNGEKDLWGDSTVAFKVYGTKGSRGELKNVRNYLNDHFKSAFAPKE